MKNILKCFLFFLLISACQNVEKAPKPNNLIPEEKMVAVLTDMVLIDAAANYKRSDSIIKNIDLGKYIYEKHQIDSAQLAESSAYYLEHFNKSKRIYEKVRTRLETKKEQLDSLYAIEDSLQKIEKQIITSKLPVSRQDSLSKKAKDSVQLFKEVKLFDSLR